MNCKLIVKQIRKLSELGNKMFSPVYTTKKVLPYDMKKMYRKNILSDIYTDEKLDYKYMVNKKYHLLIVIPRYIPY